MSPPSRTALLVLLAVTVGAIAAEPTPEEKILHDAGVATEGASLLTFLRSQTPTAEEQARHAAALGQLGHRSYSTREKATRLLVSAGRPALPLLRTALTSSDLEVARRASRAIEEIERVSYPTLISSAVRVLAQKRPTGTVDALLAYLPFVQDEEIEEAVHQSLAVVGIDKGQPHPRILAALSDREPRLRAASAYVLARTAAPPLQDLRPLLRDPSLPVRFQAAEAILRGKDRAGVDTLLGLLEEAPLTLSRRAEEMLFHLAGEASPSASLGGGDEASRRRCRQAWQSWWTANANKVDLGRLQDRSALLGITLVCLYDSPGGDGRVQLLGPDGKVRWEIGQLQGPNDAQLLPGNRVLIAERNSGRVTERDSTGKVLWEKRVEGGALSMTRLPGGNTLIASWSVVQEVGPDGARVWEYTHPGGFRHCCRTPGGRLLAITATGQILELDRAGKVARTITPERHGPGAGYWASVEQLPGGRLLAALGSSRKIVEVDEAGKILWEADAPHPVFATRTRTGHTLVCSFEDCQLIELDRSGKETSRQRLSGRPFAVRKY